MAVTDTGEPRQGIDRTRRSGSAAMVLVVALGLVAAAVGLMFVSRENAANYILMLLAALSTVGVFALFALAAGIVAFSGKDAANPMIRSLIDGAFDGVVVTDPKGRVLYANAAYLDLVNAVDARDVRPVERVFIGDPEVSEAVYRLLKAAREGRRLQEEVRFVGPGEQPARWLRLRVRPLGDSKHDRRSTVWTVADITREREKQENIFLELQHAIDYLDHAPAGFFSVDAQSAILYLNATLAAWLDYDLASVGSGGLKLSDIVSGEGASLLTTLRGAPGEVKTEVFDLDLKTRAGRTVPVRLFHNVAFGADAVAGVSRTLVLNRARDVAADPQRAAEVRFMRFFNRTPMAIATLDKGGHILRSNGLFARLFHDLLAGSGEKSTILSVIGARDRVALEAAIHKAAGGQGDIAPVDAQLAGPGERYATFYVTATEDDAGEAEAAIVYALETTQQRALENQVKQSQKMESVGQLAGGIAHDFNNVLSAIMMATDFLLNAHRPTDPSFQDIMQIKQNANRAASLVRQLLAFSRRQTLRPQVLDLNEVLSDLNMLLKRLIGESVKLDVVHGRDLWPVKADISQLEQVIVNLAVNARDAMPEGGGQLTLRTANVPAAEAAQFGYAGMPAADYAMIEARDTGSGIAPEVLGKIFEPFFTTKDIGKGTGLGLSTVYGIIKQTGGFIYPESEPGKGTTFRIFLPRHTPAPEEKDEAPAISGALAAAGDMAKLATADLTGRGTILLVEDEEGLRALNARGLASRGYTVLEASNGVEAMELIEAQGGRIDLVVSDVVMPEMDGPTLLREMRRTNPDLKMIFVSGYAEEAFQKNLPPDGKFTFLPKPFTLKQLVATVKETMAG
ncbi:MAG: Sensor kinase CckA [Pseudorhodoplanes sp.]|nr:Sensor kinase CckA [Pseudorhodoplanes sp.]